MSSFKVVSYFTPDYVSSVARLQKSLDNLQIPHNLVAVPSFRNWLEGVRWKPHFLRSQLLESKDGERPIIWLDADATVEKYPSLFDILADKCIDFACHFRNDKRYHNECLSGTLFINNTKGAMGVLDAWIAEQQKDADIWDQRSLQKALELTHSYSLYRLPPQYTQIFDTMAYAGDPVILHHQASRGKDKTAQAVNMVGNPQ
jgi:hypothetical protein